MDINKIHAVESAMDKFNDTLSILHARYARDEHFNQYMGITGFKETAALKRASMDLTRALAELRKP